MFILHILLIYVLQMFIGFLWYSKFLFGNLFMKLSKVDFTNKDMKSCMPKIIFGNLSKTIVLYLIAVVVLPMGTSIYTSITILVAMAIIIFDFDNVAYQDKPTKLFLLNSVHSFVSIIVVFAVTCLLVSYN